MKKWYKKEENYLKKNYLKLTYNELAQALNRNRKSIEWKLNNLNLKKSKFIPISNILKNYYESNLHHAKGIPKSKEHKEKISDARKKWLKNIDSEVLNKIYKKMARTKRIEGTHLGEKNPMYGKKRLDLSNRNKEQWANIEYRKKIKSILSKTIYKGSKRQKNLYNYLLNHFRNKIIYNDWKSLDYKYELDISIPSKKIAVEWDGYRWHYQNKDVEKKDLIKNNEILNKGWKFIRIKDNHLNKSQINEINKQVVYLINNIHTPEFKYTGGIYIE